MPLHYALARTSHNIQRSSAAARQDWRAAIFAAQGPPPVWGVSQITSSTGCDHDRRKISSRSAGGQRPPRLRHAPTTSTARATSFVTSSVRAPARLLVQWFANGRATQCAKIPQAVFPVPDSARTVLASFARIACKQLGVTASGSRVPAIDSPQASARISHHHAARRTLQSRQSHLLHRRKITPPKPARGAAYAIAASLGPDHVPHLTLPSCRWCSARGFFFTRTSPASPRQGAELIPLVNNKPSTRRRGILLG